MDIKVTINFSDEASKLLGRIADAMEDGVKLDSDTATAKKAPAKKAPAKKAPAKKAPAKKDEDGDEDGDQEYNETRARDAALALMKAGKADALKGVLADYGVNRVSELDASNLEDAIVAMELAAE